MNTKLFFWYNPGTIDTVISYLQSGKVVATTTDTVPGLLAQANQQGFEALNQIKIRSNKPYLLLIPFHYSLQKYAEINQKLHIETLISSCWPGPLTLILKAKPDLPAYLQGQDGTIALRVPDHQGLQKVLMQFDALLSTSANFAGQPVPQTINALDPALIAQISCMVDEKDAQAHALPSTILDCTGDAIRVVREGAYPIKQLQKIYGSQFS